MNELIANIDWYEIWLASLDTLMMLGGSLLFRLDSFQYLWDIAKKLLRRGKEAA